MPQGKERLLRHEVVLAMTALKPTTLDVLLVSGDFPAAVRTSAKTVAWLESDVQRWIKTRPRAARGAQPTNEAIDAQ